MEIKNDGDTVIWYKKDDKFQQPRCRITLRIYKQKDHLLERSDPLKQVYNDIWTGMYDEHKPVQ
jgi:secreted Zn-dependent insulinase-like peptidase